jgi:mono/diheme cytochrome c family protein
LKFEYFDGNKRSMKNPMLLFAFVALACALAMCSGCTKKSSETSAPAVTEMTAAQLAERGKSIYMSNCIACHNVDPSKDGSVGPAIAGSSTELVEARVMKAAYPEGYKPKRDTRVMVALPHLQKEIPALGAYLSGLQGTHP